MMTKRERTLTTILIWVLLLSAAVSMADDEVIDLCDLDGPGTCDIPYWYLVYEYQAEDGSWHKVLLDDSGRSHRYDCLRLGWFVVKQRFHTHSNFECISNRTTKENEDGQQYLWQERQGHSDQGEDHYRNRREQGVRRIEVREVNHHRDNVR